MATVVFNNATILLDQYNISSAMNAVAIGAGAEALDDTVFGDSTKSNKGGLKTVEISAEGRYNANTSLDSYLFSKIGAAGVPLTVIPETTVDEGRAYFIKAMQSSYTPVTGSVGELLGFSLTANAYKQELVQGSIEFNGTATSTGNSTGQQLGAPPAGKNLYAVLHCTAGSGTLDVTVESDDNPSFTSSSGQDSFAQLTGAGSELLVIPNSISDDYFRIVYTIAGGSPSFTFTVALGIGV